VVNEVAAKTHHRDTEFTEVAEKAQAFSNPKIYIHYSLTNFS